MTMPLAGLPDAFCTPEMMWAVIAQEECSGDPAVDPLLWCDLEAVGHLIRTFGWLYVAEVAAEYMSNPFMADSVGERIGDIGTRCYEFRIGAND